MNNVLRQAGTAINKEKKNRNVLHLVQILQEVWNDLEFAFHFPSYLSLSSLNSSQNYTIFKSLVTLQSLVDISY